MGKQVIELRDVSKKFRKGNLHDSLRDAIPALAQRLIRRRPAAKNNQEFWALRDVSFSVEHGEVLGIIGHNGAGKSTMLKILSGVMKPTKGAMHVNGSLSALIEIGAGFHTDLTGRQNIYLNGAILGMKRREIDKKFDRIVAFSGLEEFLDTPVKRYSTGMYARLGFAVAAHVDPEILIVDEVLSVGDYSFQNRCIARMKEIVAGGAAVIFVSHNLEAVATLCTRGLLLDHGRVVREGAPQEVIRTYLSEAHHVGDQTNKDAYLVNVTLRDRRGPTMQFETGDDAWVDVVIQANRACRELALALHLRDSSNNFIFHTSTDRLGLPMLNLEAGERAHFTWRLKLHLARGTFHLGAVLYEYCIQKLHDELFPAGVLFVTSERDVGGAVNLYPEVSRTSRNELIRETDSGIGMRACAIPACS